ncbi:MAG: hypothetical protein ACKV2T_42525 [Kofleriaceae bacterium]
MGTRSFARGIAVLLVLGCAPSSAFADAKADITTKGKEAMENYDRMEYDAAKKLLNQALAIAKKGKLDKDPVTARIYLQLGIAEFAAGNLDAAKVAFVSAVQIDAKVQIDAAYKSPDLSKLLEEARKEAGGGATKPEPTPDLPAEPEIDCTVVKGLQHVIMDTAPAAAPAKMEALVGGDITPVKVAIMYRAGGATDFTEVKMTKEGECKYTGAIPAAAMKGELVHYYVGAFDGNNKVMAAKGSSGSPNILELSAAVVVKAGPGDNEDPINGKGGGTGGGSEGSSIGGGVVAGGKAPKVMITLAGGTGFGYVTGGTEGGNMVEQCCVGNSYVVLLPELGYMVNKQLSIGLAGRIGLPIGANVNAFERQGHSTIAPGGMLRVRYALSPTGQGLRVMGQVGGGVMRNTISLKTNTPGMDTDIVAQGPLLIGGGVGYLKMLSNNFAFVADLSALAGIAIVDELGGLKVNTGFGADLSLGIAVGF